MHCIHFNQKYLWSKTKGLQSTLDVGHDWCLKLGRADRMRAAQCARRHAGRHPVPEAVGSPSACFVLQPDTHSIATDMGSALQNVLPPFQLAPGEITRFQVKSVNSLLAASPSPATELKT